MFARIVKPTYPKLIAGSAIDPNDSEYNYYWQAIHEHRDRLEQQLREMEEREEQRSRSNA